MEFSGGTSAYDKLFYLICMQAMISHNRLFSQVDARVYSSTALPPYTSKGE